MAFASDSMKLLATRYCSLLTQCKSPSLFSNNIGEDSLIEADNSFLFKQKQIALLAYNIWSFLLFLKKTSKAFYYVLIFFPSFLLSFFSGDGTLSVCNLRSNKVRCLFSSLHEKAEIYFLHAQLSVWIEGSCLHIHTCLRTFMPVFMLVMQFICRTDKKLFDSRILYQLTGANTIRILRRWVTFCCYHEGMN